MDPDLIPSLARARKAHHLTQAELAERAGLSRMTVQRLEGGSLDPRLSTLQEMARVLGLELVAVPRHLRAAVQDFIQSGGAPLGQRGGVDASSSAEGNPGAV
ncbi:transcriptional regulator [Rhodococcus sp. SRB_17]|uniref:helix-turn-helix transcriptional regulator n=1 Tax=Acidovorax sp. SRB_24 TaxID=1962700 RepID=UPI00145C53D0|nr:helix-turn-helix transcriptional regulator [Acidovorax sp. SRB_24]NMM76540.1 transcriptional regulator [Acidovorax sp. SRB_24]NMM84614.1 transcriptional regulator [Rhodococcus sp. SRB_17]